MSPPPKHLPAAPIEAGQRHEIIDIVRGFSLFGVLLANMVLTTQFIALSQEQRESLPTAQIDTVATFLTGVFVDGKFFTLFSFLFGLGFAVQLSRASHRGVSLLPTYTRRLAVLFALGALHALLLWFGDVLHIYALLGVALILFRNRSDRAILGWAIGVFVLVMSVPILQFIAHASGWEESMLFGREMSPTEVFRPLAQGGYRDVIRLNWAIHLEDYGQFGMGGNILFWYVDIFCKFLLGFYIGKRMLLQHARDHLLMFRRLLPWALLVGLAGNGYMNAGWEYGLWRPEGDFLRAVLRSLHELWIVSLSIGYLCALVVLHQHSRWGARISCLAPVGRMALTNYLLHSVSFIVVFYGIGLGLLGRVGSAVCVLLSVAIFAVQIGFSAWWLNRFRFGPVEWLWRSLTYGKLQPLRNS